MLKSIQVDGLRSLSDFKLDLHPGLNVLVGPNGSGKTNIFAALDLVANSTHLENLIYMKNLGGIEITRLFDIKRKGKKIAITVMGETEICLKSDKSDDEMSNNKTDLSYTLKFEIGFPPNNGNKLVFTYQKLKLQMCIDNQPHNFEAEYKDESFGIWHSDKIYLEHMLKNVSSDITIDTVRAFIENIHNHSKFLEYRSMVYEMSVVFEPLKEVLNELESLKVFDLDPNSIRDNFEKNDESEICRDGSGVQNVLLEICEEITENEPINDLSPDKFKGNRGVHDAIVTYLKLFLTEVSNLNVYLNEQNQKIVGEVTFDDGSKLPIEFLSEGSLKMLTIVTIILKEENTILLEEPENFLHPGMQQLIVELMRETSDNKNSLKLFSTHCETIINMLNPEEVVMTKFKNGKTTAGRFEDPEFLREAIHDSGLGLGWYYRTRALDNKPLV